MFTNTNGIGSSGYQYTPLGLTFYGTDNLKVVIGGTGSVCALKESGDVYCTGDGYSIGRQTGSDYYNPEHNHSSTSY